MQVLFQGSNGKESTIIVENPEKAPNR